MAHRVVEGGGEREDVGSFPVLKRFGGALGVLVPAAVRGYFSELGSTLRETGDVFEIASLTRTEEMHGFKVYGSGRFRKRTRAALELLSKTSVFDEVRDNLDLINEGARSAMQVVGSQFIFNVGRKTWSDDPLWYAGCIAHDSKHAGLYREDVAAGRLDTDRETYRGAEAERNCLNYQEKALREMGAGKDMLEIIEYWRDEPTYQGNSEDEYLARDW
ncbi:MAG: hypothetical protein GF416_07495 [Candidatus Altiarchaeales archaeon]|nr:hypothetical protein [Candidatus Altiarchaeales archaeon]MBD3416956.1 hypothetical protein [Candidatus Altiarchaeales archaeon]